MKTIALLFSILVSSITVSWGQVFDLQSGSTGSTNVLGPVPTLGTLLIDYQFYSIPDSMDVYYDNIDIFSSGWMSGSGQFSIPYGAGGSTSITIVINDTIPGDVWAYTPTIETVPEPGSASFLVLGISCVFYWARCKGRRSRLEAVA